MKNTKYPNQGINRSELDEILIGVGGQVERPKRTGEVIYRHPLMKKTVRGNARRKDAGRALVIFVRDVIKRTNH